MSKEMATYKKAGGEGGEEKETESAAVQGIHTGWVCALGTSPVPSKWLFLESSINGVFISLPFKKVLFSCLTSFTQHNYFEVHLYCRMYYSSCLFTDHWINILATAFQARHPAGDKSSVGTSAMEGSSWATAEWKSGEGGGGRFIAHGTTVSLTPSAVRTTTAFLCPLGEDAGVRGWGRGVPDQVLTHSRVERTACPAEESILPGPKRCPLY